MCAQWPDAIDFTLVIRGRSAVGSAEPCQGSGRRFEPGRPLSRKVFLSGKSKVGWPRGEARDCKSRYTGSNPVPTSTNSYAAGGLDKIPEQLLNVKPPAQYGITTASPCLISNG